MLCVELRSLQGRPGQACASIEPPTLQDLRSDSRTASPHTTRTHVVIDRVDAKRAFDMYYHPTQSSTGPVSNRAPVGVDKRWIREGKGSAHLKADAVV